MLFCRYYYGNQIDETDVTGTSSMNGRDVNTYRLDLETEGKRPLEDLGVNGRIILNCIKNK